MNRTQTKSIRILDRVEKRWFRLRFSSREKRMFVLLLVVLVLAAWKLVPRPWHPNLTFKTPHHTIFSTATRLQTENTAKAMEALYSSYSNNFGGLPGFSTRPSFPESEIVQGSGQLRAINPGLGWAEAFYSQPYCRAFYSASEANPFHWMLHESVHQLNTEVAHLSLAKWLEEGLADYYATSQLESKLTSPWAHRPSYLSGLVDGHPGHELRPRRKPAEWQRDPFASDHHRSRRSEHARSLQSLLPPLVDTDALCFRDSALSKWGTGIGQSWRRTGRFRTPHWPD